VTYQPFRGFASTEGVPLLAYRPNEPSSTYSCLASVSVGRQQAATALCDYPPVVSCRSISMSSLLCCKAITTSSAVMSVGVRNGYRSRTQNLCHTLITNCQRLCDLLRSKHSISKGSMRYGSASTRRTVTPRSMKRSDVSLIMSRSRSLSGRELPEAYEPKRLTFCGA
jgi:hypothetical protein